MAETAPSDTDLTTDLSAASRKPGGDAITSGMADIAERKLGEETKAFAETDQRIEQDRSYMAERMKASGLEVEKLKPWNHEEEQRKYEHSPLEAFGSFGSVVGILASAFTRAPMENAFGASAAAMNAVKAGDDEGYKKAFSAYQNNMKLVETREKMIQDGFNDANALMHTDMAAGTAKAQHIATKYGDKQALFLLENGMSKEYFDLLNSRSQALAGMSAANAKITETTFRQNTFEQLVSQLPEEQKNNPQRVMALWNYAHGMNTPEQEKLMTQYWIEHPSGTLEDAAKFAAKTKADQHAAATGLTSDRLDAKEVERRTKQYVDEGLKENEAYDRAVREVKKASSESKLNADQDWLRRYHEENPNATTEEITEAFGEFKKAQKLPTGSAGGNQNLTTDRQRAQDVLKYRQGLETSINPDTGEKYTPEQIGELAAKYESKLKATATPASGNQRDKLRSAIDRSKYFESNIDNIEALLVKHNALAGLGGKVTRPAEAIGNVFGSNETDRKQFERWVSEMQEWAPRLLNETAGRPLASEAAKVNSIVAGLNAGDTTANTVRAYRELRPLIQRIREDLAKRESGTWGAPPPAGGKGDTTSKAKPGWMSAPIVEPAPPGKRSQRGNMSDEDLVGIEVVNG